MKGDYLKIILQIDLNKKNTNLLQQILQSADPVKSVPCKKSLVTQTTFTNLKKVRDLIIMIFSLFRCGNVIFSKSALANLKKKIKPPWVSLTGPL
jgi:hypothetical protein